MHKKIIKALENESVEEFMIVGYRGCGKTTYVSNAFPLRCVPTNLHNFMVLINETTSQVQLNLDTIASECEENNLLRNDFPHLAVGKKRKSTWNTEQLEFLTTDVHGNVKFPMMIMGKSRGQRIRGLKYRHFRPQVIILDDPEDSEWVKKKTNRDKTEAWFNGEVVPAQEETGSKMIVIGNLLHKDSLLARLKQRETYECIDFPIMDDDGEIMWKGKYPDQEAIDKQKSKINNHTTWSREYLLKIIAEEDRIIKEGDLRYYKPDLLEKMNGMQMLYEPLRAAMAVDLASSEKESADYTAMVSAYLVEYMGENKIWILPNVINRHMRFNVIQNIIKNLFFSLPKGAKLGVESVQAQMYSVQSLEDEGIPVQSINPVRDKRARLQSVAPLIQNGKVMFADHPDCRALVEQLLDFGIEEHDDMVDALVYAIMLIIDMKDTQGGIGGKIDKI
jgi:predicted phage terminase large subunit-like protein